MDLRSLIRLALDEDLGAGDVTTQSTVPEGPIGTGRLLAKQDLVVCGHHVVRAVFEEVAARLDPRAAIRYDVHAPDGAKVSAGTVLADLVAPLRLILMGERVALNFAMRMSGIATNVRTYVDAAGPGGPRVVDTRKTTPLHRELEKYAVRVGGGHNHRTALYDGVLVKDNHITAVGSVTEAVRRARAASHHLLRVEVEVRTLDELNEALGTSAEVILLDNMDDATLAEAVAIARARRPSVLLEASGNITPARIATIRGFGLDIVSAGGLVHQSTWADLSLKVR